MAAPRNPFHSQGASPGTPPGGGPFGGAASGPYQYHLGDDRLNLDYRKTSGFTKLNLDTKLEDFRAWGYQVKPFLSAGREEVRQLLDFATRAPNPITRTQEAETTGYALDVAQASTAIFDGLAFCIAPSLLSRKAREAGEGRGFELWRLIHREYSSRSGPVLEAKRRAFLEPARCRDEHTVRERLTEWLCEGADYEAHCSAIPDTDKIRALVRFLPDEMSKQVDKIHRWEGKTWDQCLGWVRTIAEESHALRLSSQVAGPKPSTRAAAEQGPTPMQIGSLEDTTKSIVASLTEASAVSPDAQGDLANDLQAILKKVLKPKGNGKGREGERGGGGGGKGSGGSPGNRAEGDFPWPCHYCGKVGHRIRDCRKKDEDQRKERGLTNLEETGSEGAPVTPPPAAGAWPLAMFVRQERKDRTTRTRSRRHPTGCCSRSSCTVAGTRQPPNSFEKLCMAFHDDEEEETSSVPDLTYSSGEEETGRTAHGNPAWYPEKRHPVQCLVKAGPEWPALCALGAGKPGSGRTVEIILDSGAGESVMPPGLLPDYPTVPGQAARDGVTYTAADGGEIPNLGEQSIPFCTAEGHECQVTFQVADVQRPLMSVSALTARGNRVSFNGNGGVIFNAKGDNMIRFQRRRGVYVLDVKVSPFQGQGK